ncbi:hypothetical protein Clacol_005939 [Clathrus columnatus]|uniref:GH16 domain-containing protein n=1 Tax=Clathrus columnatus TaxID=1419009 RepID=A0AAV5ADX8_9AGAM|nr:hypothetical protein Clacol_005939 [Clathrus columnatus]
MSHQQEEGDPVLPPSPSFNTHTLEIPTPPEPNIYTLEVPTISEPPPPRSPAPRHRASVTSWPASYEVVEVGARSRSPPITVKHESSRDSLASLSRIISHAASLSATSNPFTTPPPTPGTSVKSFASSAHSQVFIPPVSVVIGSSEPQSTVPSTSATSISLPRAISSPTLASGSGTSLHQRRARRERSFKINSATRSLSTSTSNVNLTPPASPPATSERNVNRDSFASPPIFPPGISIITSGASTPSTRPGSSKHVSSWRLPSTLNDDQGLTFDLSGVNETLKGLKALEKDITPSDSSISLSDGYFPMEKDHDIPIRPSALLRGTIDKPWLHRRDWRVGASWWITFILTLLGFGAAAAVCVTMFRSVHVINSPLCMVLDENFDTLDTTNTWSRVVDMSGFQNGEFEMTTDSTNNSYVKDGVLYIVPTLTSDVIGVANVFDAFSYNVTNCTNTVDFNGCGATSNATAGRVIPPIMSGRLTTQFSHSLTDWIWPTLWMLPVNDTYGPWPASGQNFIRSSLNWGPTVTLNREFKTIGFWSDRRTSYAKGFHTYTLEWTSDYVRVYVDKRTDRSMEIAFNTPFFSRGDFPDQITNGSATVPLANPWQGRGDSAPFDQRMQSPFSPKTDL